MMAAKDVGSPTLLAMSLSFPIFGDDEAEVVTYRFNTVALRQVGMLEDEETIAMTRIADIWTDSLDRTRRSPITDGDFGYLPSMRFQAKSFTRAAIRNPIDCWRWRCAGAAAC